MKKRILSLLLAVVLVLGILPMGASATDVPSVNVFLSMSFDDHYLVGNQTGKAMALLPVTVPYFDLANYGLETFYFSSETYGDDGYDGSGPPSSDLEPGTAEFAYGKVTALHLIIYVTEVYHCGVDKENAGEGYLKEAGLLESSEYYNGNESCLLYISGTQGSAFMNRLWDGDCNLNYYVNYQYPEASAGWGATVDQILLREGDLITVGAFTDWGFYNDPHSIFNYIKADKTSVTAGEEVKLEHWRAGADLGESNGTGTAQTHVALSPDEYDTGAKIYMCNIQNMNGGDVTQWENSLGTFDLEGNFTLDTTGLAPGTYMIAIPGQPGYEYADAITSTPGGMLLTVVGDSASAVNYGDVNGDNAVDATDVSLVAQYVADLYDEIDTAAADVDKNGTIDATDVSLIAQYAADLLTSLPVESNQ